jgi:hypothetical protein
MASIASGNDRRPFGAPVAGDDLFAALTDDGIEGAAAREGSAKGVAPDGPAVRRACHVDDVRDLETEAVADREAEGGGRQPRLDAAGLEVDADAESAGPRGSVDAVALALGADDAPQGLDHARGVVDGARRFGPAPILLEQAGGLGGGPRAEIGTADRVETGEADQPRRRRLGGPVLPPCPWANTSWTLRGDRG